MKKWFWKKRNLNLDRMSCTWIFFSMLCNLMLMPHALLSTISEKLQACLTSLAWQFVQWNYKENNRQDLNAKYILNTEGVPGWESPLSHNLTPKKFSLLARFCLYKEREAVFVRVMTLVVLKWKISFRRPFSWKHYTRWAIIFTKVKVIAKWNNSSLGPWINI